MHHGRAAVGGRFRDRLDGVTAEMSGGCHVGQTRSVRGWTGRHGVENVGVVRTGDSDRRVEDGGGVRVGRKRERGSFNQIFVLCVIPHLPCLSG